MAYIPKSAIKENQYTPGGEWYYIKNNEEYIGYYYLLSTGEAFTGKNPNDPPNSPIFQNKEEDAYSSMGEDNARFSRITYATNFDGYVYENQYQNIEDVTIYGILEGTNYNLVRKSPSKSTPLPTPEDYIKGRFVRYFVSRINQLEFMEVNKKTYDNLKSNNEVWLWEEFICFTLNWYISGDIDVVFNNNKGGIFIAEKNINRKGLDKYLKKDYLQYYLYTEAENLTTLGGELITPQGKDYVGEYHIHEFQGPMEGGVHVSTPHRKLFYKRFYMSEVVNPLNQEGVVETGETQNIEYRSLISTDPNYVPPTTPSSPSSSPTPSGGSSTGGGY